MTNTGGAALCKWGGSGARAKLRTMVTPQEMNGSLNPTWVEWLQGFPLKWTEVEDDEKRMGGSEGGTESSKFGRQDVRELRIDASASAAPSRLQQANGRADTLSEMPRGSGYGDWSPESEAAEAMQGLRFDVHAKPQQEAQHMQRRMPFGDWPHECDEAVGQWDCEPGEVPRVAVGVKNRVDRLKGLGNAVVPQIPELIGRAIMQAVTP